MEHSSEEPKIAIVDIQGFYINEQFHPKEISIILKRRGKQYFLLKPPVSFSSLTIKDQEAVRDREHRLGLKFSDGYVRYELLNGIISNLLSVKRIYVHGERIADYLFQKVCEFNRETEIINIAKFKDFEQPPPKFLQHHTLCFSHTLPIAQWLPTNRCAENNVEAINQWITNYNKKNFL